MSCGCDTNSNGASSSANKVLKVDFLFLDESVCVPCGSTSEALSQAIDMVTPSLKAMGIALEVAKIHVADQNIAIAEKFLSSPTIRVNGKDIDPARTEDDCPSCGSLAGDTTSVSCRTWHWQDNVYQAASVGKIVEEIMAAAMPSSAVAESCCGSDEAKPEFVLPDNLKGFFAARASDEHLSC